jgi:hypothetical protein
MDKRWEYAIPLCGLVLCDNEGDSVTREICLPVLPPFGRAGSESLP